MRLSGLARQGGVFASVGLAATGVHVVTALTARAALQWEPLTANLAGFACAVGLSYVGNARLTFRTSSRDAAQLARFVAVSLLGLGLGQAVVWLLVERGGWSLPVALGPVVVVVPALNFTLSKVWAFRRPPPPEPR